MDSPFIWFLGIVEDIMDPKMLGRVKVRMISEYSNRVESEDIPWAMPLVPITSASLIGLGTAPVGLQTGSRVIGFYLDGEQKTKPMVLGSYPIIQNGDESEHSVSGQARGNGEIKKDYLDDEPKSAYAAEYPNNSTITTVSGHLIEIDDTPKAERIHIYHKSGSYIEMFPDGSTVVKSADSSLDISKKDKSIISDTGSIKLNSKKESINIGSKKDISIAPEENLSLSGNSIKIDSDGDITINGSNITIKGSSVKLEGDVKVNGKTI